jgi:DNA-binding XRE family transcriptional regulator
MVTAEQLRAARAMLQMDQAELAKISGVSVETIKRLERQTGKLHAKIETISAIRKTFETRRVEFLGDHDSVGAGVRLIQPDKVRALRGALIAKWTHLTDQWIEAQCATDPKFFERGEKRLTETLMALSANIIPGLVRSLLPEEQETGWEPAWAASNVNLEGYNTLSNYVPFMSAEPFLSATTRARDDASHVTWQMLGLIEDPSNLGGARNRPFARAFVGAFPISERGALTDAKGNFSAEGLIRVKNAVLAKAYGDPEIACRLTENSTDEDIKSITSGLVMAAPRWAKFRADMVDRSTHPDSAKTSDLSAALKHIVDSRSRGHKLQDYLAQPDASDKVPKAIEHCMRMFYNAAENRAASAETIAKKLRLYAEESAKMSKRGKSSRK